MMSFTTAIKTCFKKYFTISGRATRAEYWWFKLFSLLLLVGYLLIIIIWDSVVKTNNDALAVVFFLLIIFLIIPNFCLLVRRFHDIGLSGGTVLIVLILGGLFLGDVILNFIAIRGSADDNEHGPNPFKSPIKVEDTTEVENQSVEIKTEDVEL